MNHTAVKVASAVMMALSDTDAGPQPTTVASHRELQRQRDGKLILEKSSVDWDVQDKYVEPMNFKVEVTNILETRVYEQTDKENIQVIKNCLGQDGAQLIKTFTHKEKDKCRTAKGFFHY